MAANVAAGGVRQGGSTITQQLAKTSFLSSDRSYKRKAQEVIIAFWLEGWLTKDEILSRYLSSVYFGDGVYGLRAASRHYFGRRPGRFVAGPVGDARRDGPGTVAAGSDAPSRRRAEARPAGAWRDGRDRRDQPGAGGGDDPGAGDRITRPGADRNLFRRLGRPRGVEGVRERLRRGPRCDHARRRPAEDCGARDQQCRDRRCPGGTGRDAARRAGRGDGRRAELQVKRPFNRATQARRQPGSAFKLFVYLAALRAGYTPRQHHFRPAGDDRRLVARPTATASIAGDITLRDAFARSSNAATVRLSEAVGRGNVLRAARELGISSPLPDSPSVALGTAGVSLLELTAAYAAVAGGRYPVRAARLAGDRRRRSAGDVFRARRRARRAARLGADARPVVGGDQRRHRPPRGAARPDLRQDRDDARAIATPCSSVSPAIWWSACGSGATTISRSAKSAAGRRRRGSGAPSWRPRWRSTDAPDPSFRRSSACPQPKRRESQSPLPDDWSEGTRAIRDLFEQIGELIEKQ